MTTRAAWLVQHFYNGTPADKLASARRLHAVFAARPEETALAAALAELRKHAEALAAHMRRLDFGTLCSACASRTDGGCCSAYMADNVDAVLLLINLLLGGDVRPVGTDPAGCRFLGERGCVLLIKPIFCLNYNCRAILDTTPAAGLAELFRRAAAVLGQQTRVEELLLARLDQSDLDPLEPAPPNPREPRPAC